MSDTLEFEYKPKLGRVFLGLFLFGLGGLYLAEKALSNDSGLVLNHVIKFSEAGATIFYWLLAAILAGLFVLSCVGILSALLAGENTYIRLTDSGLYIPHGLLRKQMRLVPYQSITGIKMQKLREHYFLTIENTEGNVGIASSCFESTADFDSACKFILSKTKR